MRTLNPGSRLGPYEVLSAIGAGGMGEVYRARDTKLNRDVALKILPAAVADDAERVARFRREAQVLASLNHPHIAAIFGFEESNGLQALVLELVDGPTLADRLTQGPVPTAEALRMARQIAEAVEAAHQQGIIHRDLKPANIKWRPDGTVKVLDFGLAKALEPAPAVSGDLTASPTITSPAMTRMGVILGTAAYMAPEQAKGRAADKQSDVWAFGCVLYELLTGKRAFEGEDMSDTLATVLKGEPDWSALPSDLPDRIRTLVMRCLAKDRRERVPDISVARYVMSEAASAGVAATAAVPRTLIGVAGMGLVAGAIVTAILVWAMTRPRSSDPPRLTRFAIVPPTAQALVVQPNPGRDLAISPDGTQVVYHSGRGSQTQLVVRALDELDGRPIASTVAGRAPFFSPDGRWIGFFAGPDLSKVAITGGPSIVVCSALSGGPRGASWGPDGTIVFATQDPSSGLLSVPQGGGTPTTLTTPDTAQGEQDHLYPSFLPGGRAVLFTITAGGIENAQVAVLDLKTGVRKTLVRGGSSAEYVETGHLVYAAAGTLRAVRFDAVRLEVLSDPVPVLEQVTTGVLGAADFAVSRQGTLVYVPGEPMGQNIRSLVWVDRRGREEPINAPARPYATPRLSPDGTRLAVDIRDQQQDIWILEFGRGTLTRLTTDPSLDQMPVWTPDGRRIVFSSQRTGSVGNLYWQAADGTGTVERLSNSLRPQFPYSVSPDGTRLSFATVQPRTTGDVLALDLPGAGERRTEPLVATTANEYSAEISPDGRWLAYQSNESGENQVWVRPFPRVDGGRWQVSTDGGRRPVWARTPGGLELFYLDKDSLLTSAAVQDTGTTFTVARPTRILNARYFFGAAEGTSSVGRTYDVSADGQRFVMLKEIAAADESKAPASIVVVLNWHEELKRRLPSK